MFFQETMQWPDILLTFYLHWLSINTCKKKLLIINKNGILWSQTQMRIEMCNRPKAIGNLESGNRQLIIWQNGESGLSWQLGVSGYTRVSWPFGCLPDWSV